MPLYPSFTSAVVWQHGRDRVFVNALIITSQCIVGWPAVLISTVLRSSRITKASYFFPLYWQFYLSECVWQMCKILLQLNIMFHLVTQIWIILITWNDTEVSCRISIIWIIYLHFQSAWNNIYYLLHILLYTKSFTVRLKRIGLKIWKNWWAKNWEKKMTL